MSQGNLIYQMLRIYHSEIINVIMYVGFVLRQKNTIPGRPFDILLISDHSQNKKISSLADCRLTLPNVIN